MKTSTLIVFLLFAMIGPQMVKDQENISVMSFNVRYDELFYDATNTSKDNWPNRREFQVALFNFHQPDVIGMQEPLGHQVEYLGKALPNYKWIGVGREDGKNEGEYNPIFYKDSKMKLLSSGTFWLSETPRIASKSWDAGYTRICTWALFQLKGSGKKFYFFNTHFDSKGEKARLESAKLLNKRISELESGIPVFITGDFNLRPDTPAYAELTAHGLYDSKKISKTRPYGAEGTFNGFKFNVTPVHRIDYIFVNGPINVLRHGTLTDNLDQRYPSDHLPIIVYAQF